MICDVYTAPDPVPKSEHRHSIFLAGGIVGCKSWQDEVIENLKYKINWKKYCVSNPRRSIFPIDDETAAGEQIAWEFDMLERCDIFSMYFVNSDSVQPICMYELGRNVLRMKEKYPQTWKHRIIVSIEDGYKRADDVNIQLSMLGVMAFNDSNPYIHAQMIAIAANNLLN